MKPWISEAFLGDFVRAPARGQHFSQASVGQVVPLPRRVVMHPALPGGKNDLSTIHSRCLSLCENGLLGAQMGHSAEIEEHEQGRQGKACSGRCLVAA
jgi:hypothetical protein